MLRYVIRCTYVAMIRYPRLALLMARLLFVTLRLQYTKADNQKQHGVVEYGERSRSWRAAYRVPVINAE